LTKQERQPHRGERARLAEQGEDAGADYRANAERQRPEQSRRAGRCREHSQTRQLRCQH
jgi:hypothetical protein